MTLETLTTLFGWMTVLNIGMLAITTLFVLAGREKFAAMHANMFGLDTGEVKKAYFAYLSNFKIVVLVFCLAPYIALKLM